MAQDVEVRVRDEDRLKGSIVVVGLPTVGHVGTIAGQYVVDALEMEHVGGIFTEALPPMAVIDEGRAAPPLRIHAIETACGLGLTCDHLVVITGGVLPAGRAVYRVAEAIVAWCERIEAAAVVILEGVVVEGEGEGDDVTGVVATEDGLKLLSGMGVEPMGNGMIVGLSAAVIHEAEEQGVPVVCLLTETNPTLPDARAASRLVQLMDKMVPDIHIETEPLVRQAEAIEEQVRAMIGRIAAHERASHTDIPMVQ